MTFGHPGVNDKDMTLDTLALPLTQTPLSEDALGTDSSFLEKFDLRSETVTPGYVCVRA